MSWTTSDRRDVVPADEVCRQQGAGDGFAQAPISVIIPVLNEEFVLGETLRAVRAGAPREVIVVDGGSHDASREVAQAYGARTLSADRGRARQMNAGAAVATSPILLFLHADTRLPAGFEQHVRKTLAKPEVVAGAFALQIGARHWSYRVIEKLANLRARCLQMPYGDQGLFVRAEVFHRLGGFPDLPILEDVALLRRLQRSGRVAVIPVPAVTSARRWERLGVWRTAWINQYVLLGYWLGVDPERLIQWYHGGAAVAQADRS